MSQHDSTENICAGTARFVLVQPLKQQHIFWKTHSLNLTASWFEKCRICSRSVAPKSMKNQNHVIWLHTQTQVTLIVATFVRWQKITQWLMMFLPKTIILHSFYVGSSPISDCEMPGSGRADVSPSQACGRSVSFSATNPENSRWTQFDRSDDQWVLYHPVAVWYAVENSGGLRGLQWVYTRLITFASFFVFASRPFSRVSFERSIQNWVKLSRSSGRLFQSCPLDQKSTLKASSELCWCPAIKTHYNILKHMKTFGHVWKHMKTYGNYCVR